MKRLLFSIFLAAISVLVGVFVFATVRSRLHTSQSYFESGKAFYDEQKFSEASVQFLNAVRKDKTHRDARFYLALSYMNERKLPEAVGQLKALLEDHPEDVPANLKLGGILVTGGFSNPDLYRQARQIADRIVGREPKNVEALVLAGSAAAGLEDYPAAVELFERALLVEPDSLSALLALGTTQVLLKNYPEAEKVLLRAREVGPREKGVFASLGNFYRLTGDLKKAESEFKEALVVFPTDKVLYLQLVDLYDRSGRAEEAEKVLTDVQARSPDSPDASLLLSDFYTARNRTADARKLLLGLKETFPRNSDVAEKIARSFLLDQPERARKEIDQIIQEDPKNPAGPALLGELQFNLGQYDEAETTLGKPLVMASPYPEIHFFLGNIASRKGQLDKALAHYQQSLAVNDGYIPARVALAETLMAQGQRAPARDEIRKALALQPNYIPARLAKASIENADQKSDGAERELLSILSDAPNSPLVYRQIAIYAESRGKTADAERNFIKAADLQPDSPDLLGDLVHFFLRRKQPDRAIARINTIPENKKTAVHYELLGIAYSEAGKFEDAQKASMQALAKEPGRSSVDVNIVFNYLRSGRMDEALKKLDEILKRNPSDSDAMGMKGQILESQGRIEEAKQQYQRALAINPKLDFVANNLAWIMAKQGTDLTGALNYAQTARKLKPENPVIADTLGWIYFKLGSYRLAREQLLFAVSKQPDKPEFQYHLGLIYRQTGQAKESEAALKKAAAATGPSEEKDLAIEALKGISSGK